MNSGTDALRLSLLALKEKYQWPNGSLVAVTTQTFVATVNVIFQSNLTPYFFDAGNPWRLEHDFRCAAEDISKTIKCIMPVHLFGEPCDPYTFKLAEKYKWKVLEDSCETILNPIKGDVSCYSTYMAHHITTGVGGVAVTNDDRLNSLIRSYANHGRNEMYLPGYKSLAMGKDLLKRRFRFDRIGYSCRATEFEAALGLSQLGGIKENIEKRRLVATMLVKTLMPFWDDIHFDEPGLSPNHTFMMFPIRLKENSREDKYDLCLHLEKWGIETRDAMPITSQPCYNHLFKLQREYPYSDYLNQRAFYIPCHPGMDHKDMGRIKKAFTSFFRSPLKK